MPKYNMLSGRTFKKTCFSQIVTMRGIGKITYRWSKCCRSTAENNRQRQYRQTEQMMDSLQIALSASGATSDNLAELPVYIVRGRDFHREFRASAKYPDGFKNLPAVTGFFVAALAHRVLLANAIVFMAERQHFTQLREVIVQKFDEGGQAVI